MKQKNVLIGIGVITALALGYYIYQQKQNKKVQDVKNQELKDAASGKPAGTTPSIAVGEKLPESTPISIDPMPVKRAILTEEVSTSSIMV